ncbi:MAG: hypothetical protein WBV70_04895 [Candidatus Bathyarchaeia archaeon]
MTVDGRLIRYQLPNGRNEKPHRPFILILGTPIGKVLIRGNWTAIKQGISKTQTPQHSSLNTKNMPLMSMPPCRTARVDRRH